MTAAGEHDALERSKFDLAALEALYRALAPDILRWLRARLADPEVARDLLAETFAQVIVGVSRYRGASDREAAGWVWGIARNLLRHYYRRQRVEVSARHRLGMLTSDRAPEPDDTTAVDPAVGVVLRAALDDLPRATRDCVLLRMVDELSYDEIASRVGCSAPAARQRVSRGLRQLAIVVEVDSDV